MTHVAVISGQYRQNMSQQPFDESDRGRGSSRQRRGSSDYVAPEAEDLLRRVIEIVETAPGMPMSASVRLNRDEILELLQDAVDRFPDELRSARWLLKEREEVRAKAAREAEQILATAKATAARKVERTEVVRAAEHHAAQIREDAEAAARRMIRETEDFCDQRLASFENQLVKVHKVVARARERLSAPGLEETALAPEEHDVADQAASSRAAVFDQDQ